MTSRAGKANPAEHPGAPAIRAAHKLLVQRTSGYPQVNTAWMWGALLAATMAAWLHQLTATALGEDIVHGHGVRGGKAMIATLRWRLIAVPGRLVHHARHLVLRLPTCHSLLHEVLARLRALPVAA